MLIANSCDTMTDSTGYGLLSKGQKKLVPRYENGCSVPATTLKISGIATKLHRNFGISQQ